MKHDDVLEKALPVYCKWLNSFVPNEPECHHHPIDFTYDRPNDHYGFTYRQLVVPGQNAPDLFIYRVSTGDEGGPSTLYVWVYNDDIVHMVHEFDMMICNVCSTDGMTNELIYDTRYTKED